MINIKYYVFLLVGIFLAIGLGMMIGITLEDQNVIENQQTQLIRSIEDQFTSLRTETAELKESMQLLEDQRDQLHELSNMLLTEVIRNKLTDMHIGVISFARDVPMGDILDFLRLTGATVQSAVTFSTAVPGRDLAASTGQYPDEMVTAVIHDLAFSMNYGGITPLIREAEEIKLITNDGGYEAPIDVLILMGKGSPTLPYDKLMIQSALDAGIRIVAIEAGDLQESAIAEYKAFGISTVDHAESIYGKLALVSILSGYQGNFGFGAEAQDTLPNPLFFEMADMEHPEQSISANGEEVQ